MNFTSSNIDLSNGIVGTYDWYIVVLSIFIAILGSFSALELIDRIRRSGSRLNRAFWLATGAVAMGSGVWGMHFIGMVAYRLPVPVSYDLTLTLVSTIPAILVGAVSYYAVNCARAKTLRIILGGIAMGGSIGAMHVAGMMALRVDGVVYHDPILFAASFAVAMSLAMLALQAKFFLAARVARRHAHWLRLVRACLLGFTVSGMHYTAMAAVHIIPFASTSAELTGLQPDYLAVLVGSVILGFIGVTNIASTVGHRLEAALALEKEVEVRRAAEKVLAEQNQRFEAVLTNMSQGMCMFDKHLRIVVCNQRYASLYGLSPSQVSVGTELRQILEFRVANGLHAGDKSQDYVREILSWAARREYGKKVLHLNDGRIMEITQQPTPDGGWISTHEDITDLVRTEGQFAQANPLHHLNSPPKLSSVPT